MLFHRVLQRKASMLWVAMTNTFSAFPSHVQSFHSLLWWPFRSIQHHEGNPVFNAICNNGKGTFTSFFFISISFDFLSWLVTTLWKPGSNLSALLTHSFYIVALSASCWLVTFLLLEGSTYLAAACLGENVTVRHLSWGVKSECMEHMEPFLLDEKGGLI